MDSQTLIVTHYVILIGINDYPDQPLRGCVRDVQDTKAHLESTLQGTVKIQILTTSQTDSSALWPTYDNVISAFKEVTSLAKAGDFAYIHYSGHGTREPPSSEFSSKSTGDLALVLLEGGGENGVSYFWGHELEQLLKAMTDKGLIVTLVLDCCFSASVYRNDDDACIRFLPYDAKIGSKHPPKPKGGLVSEGLTYRDASTLPNWLINPSQCAIIAACGPHEIATELTSKGQYHGTMSYFLLQTIKSVGLTKRHRDIYNYVLAKLRGSGMRRQNPVLYGNKNQHFFGRTNEDITAAAVSVVVAKNGTIELQAGHAHGVCDGDQFILHPLGPAKDDPQSQQLSVVSKVTHSRALTSDLELLDLPSIHVRTGWMAEPDTRLSLQGFPIRLPSDIPHRDEWVTALKARSLVVDTDKATSAFNVTLKTSGEYKILHETGDEIANLPSMPQDQTSVSKVSDILEHLARFWLVKDLGNEASVDSFRESYEVYIQSDGKDYGPSDQLEVKHGTIAELVVKNWGEKALYVFAYDLGPSWQVENVIQGTYVAIPPLNDGGRAISMKRVKLQMKVPNQMKAQGYRSCEDIVKVFVTSRPTSFDLLELPKLGGPARPSKPNRTDQVGEVPENWEAINFAIRTSLQ
jgi:Caspase domain